MNRARGARAGTVRIIAGSWRGRRIPVPPVATIRPTGERIRETLFNWLRPAVVGASCLDLYAGTGILGLEALSRGAATCRFVDSERRATAALSEQVARLAANATVVSAPAAAALANMTPGSLDIVFVDPPFEVPVTALPLAQIRRCLAPGGLIYLEQPASRGLPEWTWGTWWRHAQAGDVSYGLIREVAESDT